MARFGLSAALSTPFSDKGGAGGDVDIARMVDHAGWCLANGCDSITLFGTTGEGASIGLSTRRRIIDAMIKADIAPRTQLLSTIAAAAVEDAAEQARMALDADVRGLLLTPPFYFRSVDEDGIYRWFADLFHRLGPAARDMFAYHLPSVTGIALSVDLIGRLKRDFPGVVVGVKDSGSNWAFTEPLLAAHKDLMILVGDERDLGRAVRAGGSGAISGVGNIFPRLLRPVAHDGANEPRIKPLVDAICSHPVLPAIKTIIADQKRDPDWRRMRAPLKALDDAAAAQLLKAVATATA